MTTNTVTVQHVELVLVDDECTAAEALATFAARSAAPQAIGFAYSPTAAPWFRLEPSGVARKADGSDLTLTGVFELRAFTANRELRWWNTAGGGGRARIVVDQQVPAETAPGSAICRGETYRRLLWGRVRSVGNGWATLFEPRIGTLDVPITDAAAGAEIWLHAVEYHSEDEHGNVGVVDERLTHLMAGAKESRHDEQR